MAEPGTVHTGAGIATAGVPIQKWQPPQTWGDCSLVLAFDQGRYVLQPHTAVSARGASLVLDFAAGQYLYAEAPPTSGTARVDYALSASSAPTTMLAAYACRATRGSGENHCGSSAVGTAALLAAAQGSIAPTVETGVQPVATYSGAGFAQCGMAYFWKPPTEWQSASLVLDFASQRYGTQAVDEALAAATGASLILDFTTSGYFAVTGNSSAEARVDDISAGAARVTCTAIGAGVVLASASGATQAASMPADALAANFANLSPQNVTCAAAAKGRAQADYVLQGEATGLFAPPRIIRERDHPATLGLDFTTGTYTVRVVGEHALFIAAGAVSAGAQVSGHCIRRMRIRALAPLIVPSPDAKGDAVIWAIAGTNVVARAKPFGTTWHLLYGSAVCQSAAVGTAEHRRAVKGHCSAAQVRGGPSLSLDFVQGVYLARDASLLPAARVGASAGGRLSATAEIDSDPLTVLAGVRHWSARGHGQGVVSFTANAYVYAKHLAVGRAYPEASATRLPGGKVICAPKAHVTGFGLIQTPFLGESVTHSAAEAAASARLAANGWVSIAGDGHASGSAVFVAHAAGTAIARVQMTLGSTVRETSDAEPADAAGHAAGEARCNLRADSACAARAELPRTASQFSVTPLPAGGSAALRAGQDVLDAKARGRAGGNAGIRAELLVVSTTARSVSSKGSAAGGAHRTANTSGAFVVVSASRGEARARFEGAANLLQEAIASGYVVPWPKIPVEADPVDAVAQAQGTNRTPGDLERQAPADRTVVVAAGARTVVAAAEQRVIEASGMSRQAAA